MDGRICDVMRLRKQYGPGRWRKLKGTAAVRLEDDTVRVAELRWYEAHGIGRRKMKIRKLIDIICSSSTCKFKFALSV